MAIENIHSRIKKLREQLKLDQTQFGAVLGVRQQTISEWERGAYDPPLRQLRFISHHFSVNLKWLLSGEGELLLQTHNPTAAHRSNMTLGVPLIDHWSGGYPEVALEGVGEFAPMEPLEGGLAFVLRESGMHPKLQPGDYISFVPGDSYNPGDLVVVADEFGDLMVRYYRERNRQTFLVAETTAYPIIETVTLKYRVLGKLHEAVRKLKL